MIYHHSCPEEEAGEVGVQPDEEEESQQALPPAECVKGHEVTQRDSKLVANTQNRIVWV